MKITIIPPVKCSLCKSSRVVTVLPNLKKGSKPCGRFCQECRMYQNFSPLEYTKVMHVKAGRSEDHVLKEDFTFFVRKKS